jgi:hypothetical protein
MLSLHSGVTRNRLSRRNTSPRCFARLHPVGSVEHGGLQQTSVAASRYT